MTTRVSVEAIRAAKARGERLTMLTAYDYSLAAWVDRAGVDIVLVGDSLGMVMLGYATTAPVTTAEMLHHCRAVSRAVKRALVIGDLPKEVLTAAPADIVRRARLFLKAGCDAVKIEWQPKAASLVRRMTRAGIAVMGHVGLTPQAVEDPTQFRVQGRTATDAARILDSARRLEAAGCFSVVLECVPSVVAEVITRQLAIPTIGIGAGPECDGQVLVLHDVLGLYPQFSPKFAKQYAKLGEATTRAVQAFCADVTRGQFPGPEHAFSMRPAELQKFLSLARRGQAVTARG